MKEVDRFLEKLTALRKQAAFLTYEQQFSIALDFLFAAPDNAGPEGLELILDALLYAVNMEIARKKGGDSL